MDRQLDYISAVREALFQAMEQDPAVICFGLGVTDPRGVFGSTIGLAERFGPERVFDMPTSENAMTGIAIGAALEGIRPVMMHQRLDFCLLALDQLVNNAAKWFYMFGGKTPVPLTIRLITGMGWGQGPTHSQSLHSWFAHIPGLKVVMPTFAADAKGLLLSAIFDPNPVIVIEHRWLHHQLGTVPTGDHRVPLGQANLLRQGKDLTIVAFSFLTIEALRALETLEAHGVSCDLIDLRTIKPLDRELLHASVRKTGRLLVLDPGNPFCSVASEIVAEICCGSFEALQQPPVKLTLPDVPLPTSPALTQDFYVRTGTIIQAAGVMLGRQIPAPAPSPADPPHDVPGPWFKGPF